MDLGAILNVLTITLIAVAGWLQPRLTTRGRLLTEIGQLGDAAQKLPDSKAKTAIESRLLESAATLADWLDPANRLRRRAQTTASWVLYVAALAIIFFATPYFSLDPLGQLWTVVIAMFVTLALMALAMWLIERVGAKQIRKMENRAAAERASRILVKPTSD